MGTTNVKLLGMEDTIKQIRRFELEKITDAKKIIKETANQVKKDAKSRVSVLTGETKSSIGYRTYNGGLSIKVKPKRITGYRAHWLEYGTTKMSARPFMTPAEKNAEGDFNRKVEKLVKEDRTI